MFPDSVCLNIYTYRFQRKLSRNKYDNVCANVSYRETYLSENIFVYNELFGSPIPYDILGISSVAVTSSHRFAFLTSM